MMSEVRRHAPSARAPPGRQAPLRYIRRREAARRQPGRGRPAVSLRPLALPRRPGLVLWTLVGGTSGVLVGAAAAVDATLSLALVGGLVVVLAAGLRTAAVPAVMSTQIFFEQTLPSFIGIIAAGIAVAEWSMRRAELRPGPPLAWAGGYLLWALASGLWADSPRFWGLLAALAIALCSTLALAMLVRSAADLRLVLYAVGASATLTGLLSVWQYLGGAERPGGGVGDPNVFAMYQIFALPLIVALAAAEHRGILRLLALGAALIVIASIFTSLSRGGVLALGVVLLAMLLMPGRTVFRSFRQRAAVALVLVVGAGAVFTTVQDRFIDRVNDEESAGGTGRTNQWRAAGTAFQENPVLGIGFGGFFDASNELMRRTEGVDLRTFRLAEPGYRAHNAFLETAADLGLPGLALFLGVLISTVQALRRTARRAVRHGDHLLASASNAVVLSLIGWAVASFFLSSQAAFVVWMVVGLALALPKVMDAVERGEPEGPR